jgi:hypothetical protein
MKKRRGRGGREAGNWEWDRKGRGEGRGRNEGERGERRGG